MLKESEAKLKWCPLARMNNGVFGGFNRWDDKPDHPACMCVASACMAWRSEVVSLSHADRDGEHPEIVMGYCGAFGKDVR